jgi:hypothetical protein
MIAEVAPCRLLLTNLAPEMHVPAAWQAAANFSGTQKSVLDLGVPLERICLLDSEAPDTLCPEDAARFRDLLQLQWGIVTSRRRQRWSTAAAGGPSAAPAKTKAWELAGPKTDITTHVERAFLRGLEQVLGEPAARALAGALAGGGADAGVGVRRLLPRALHTGINSYQCMEATPSLACANKCTFCWRHHRLSRNRHRNSRDLENANLWLEWLGTSRRY